MIEKSETRVVRIQCRGCGMVVKVSEKGSPGDILICPKCKGREFDEINKTEVITK